MKLKLFAGCMVAIAEMKNGSFGITQKMALYSGSGEVEVKFMLHDDCFKSYPREDGYFHHSYMRMEVPQELIDKFTRELE